MPACKEAWKLIQPEPFVEKKCDHMHAGQQAAWEAGSAFEALKSILAMPNGNPQFGTYRPIYFSGGEVSVEIKYILEIKACPPYSKGII